jgi:hypothetical protein
LEPSWKSLREASIYFHENRCSRKSSCELPRYG